MGMALAMKSTERVFFRVTFKSGRKVDGSAVDADEAARIASTLLDPHHPDSSASYVDILATPGQERVCEIEDGVTEWCRGCGALKREHPTYPRNPHTIVTKE